MTRAKILQPDLILGDTILGLSLEILSQHQIKGLILDAYNNGRRNFAQEELSNLNLSKVQLLRVNFLRNSILGQGR